MDKRWYSVSVLSNFEKRVAGKIRDAVEQRGLKDEIEEVIVPVEEVTELRRGKKTTVERRLMPGYVLVRMAMTDRAYHLINETQSVIGFLGPQGRPTPMRDSEATHILKQVEEGADSPRPAIIFEIGEQVSVTDGPFEGFQGLVEDVDVENARLKVSVSIFGRATPVDLDYTQVAKAA